MASSDDEKKRARGTFAARVSSAFALIAVMTAVMMAAVSFLVWNAGRGRIFGENGLLIALVIAGGVSIILAVMIGSYFARDLIAPVERISKTATRIKDGDLSARTYLTGDDELAELGQSFDAMAESIERDRSLERQLIGDVAHELRTPLMAMQATIEAIQDGVLPADEARLSTLSNETRRLGRLVEALLHLNRLENGTIVAKKEPVQLSEALADLALNHQMLIESAGLGFAVQIDPEIRVIGDKDLLNQAVANLLSNAVRYTPEGGQIMLTCVRHQRSAVISVVDTGIGISSDDLKHVFSRFWRADEARQQTSGGLGIGLSLVREVVDQHSGRVMVDSELGEGSTFQISIPLAPDDPSILPPIDPRRRNKGSRRNPLGQRKQDKPASTSSVFNLRSRIPSPKDDPKQ